MARAGMEIPSSPASYVSHRGCEAEVSDRRNHSSEISVEVVPHPRDLNLMFAVFGGASSLCRRARFCNTATVSGGVVLCNLVSMVILFLSNSLINLFQTKRDIVCAYELVIPAGASGGGGFESQVGSL